MPESLRRFAKHACREQLEHQAKEVRGYSDKSSGLVLKAEDLKKTSYYVALAWSLSPWAIVTCAVKSTGVFTNLFIALALHSIVTKRYIRSILAISIASYLSFYPIILVVPMTMFFINKETERLSSAGKISSNEEYFLIFKSYVVSSFSCFCVISFLMYLSFIANGSWDFIEGIYMFILTVPDYTPNLGVFWYFFAEMFEHFRIFFQFVFQMNLFLYSIPLIIRFKEQPLYSSCILLIFMSVLKSYPSYSDLCIYMAILPIWRHLTPWINDGLVVGVMLLVSSMLAPVLSYLWLWSGSANANFYFAISLVHASAQIFLASNLLKAFVHCQHALKHGKEPVLENGEKAILILE